VMEGRVQDQLSRAAPAAETASALIPDISDVERFVRR
jgi:hypothetical protein